MNITPIRRPTLAPLIWLPAGLPYVHHRCRQRDHTRRAPRISFSDGDDVTTSRPGGTSNSDPGLRVRLPLLKSP
jgi:hypothetical protein